MYRASNDIRTAHLQDGAIVLDVRRGQIFGLNPVGSKILQLLEAGHTEVSVVSEISRYFEIGEDIVRRDLREFIDSLAEQRLIEPTRGDSGNNPLPPSSCSKADS